MANTVNISEKDVERLLNWEELMDVIENSLVMFSQGKVVQPQRSVMEIPPNKGTLIVMPGYIESLGTLAMKMITVFPGNSERNLPSHASRVMYFDNDTGILKAMIDSDLLTAKRTAAASAVATKAILTAQPKILAVIGSGVQGQSHIEIFSRLYEFESIRLWNRNQGNALKLANKLQEQDVKVEVVGNAKDAVADADIICTCTNSQEVIILKNWVKKGAIINCVGAVFHDLRELDSELYQDAVVLADSRQSAMVESGDIIAAKVDIFAEIGEVLSEKKLVESDGKTIIFKSQGLAIEDAVCAKLIYDKFMNVKPDL